MVKLLDGVETSRIIREGMADAVEDFVEKHGWRPGLAVVLASDDPASRIYVKKKVQACAEVGIRSALHVYKPTDGVDETPEAYVRKVLTQTGFIEPTMSGILVQSPIAGVEDPTPLFDLVPPEKDVDVFNSKNVGMLAQGRPRFKPCTPAGIIALLEMNGIDVFGKTVCIINNTNIVGRPLAMLLTQMGATVTLCHKDTDPTFLRYISSLSQIVVTAVGKPGFLTAGMVAKGAVVVDVGISRLPDGKVVGDVDFAEVSKKAAWITPVPGGVGPMTVTMLLENTLQAAKLQAEHGVRLQRLGA